MPIFKGEELLFNEIMTMDNVNLGYIAAIRYNDIIVISKWTKQEYGIPKSRIIRYSEREVLIDILSKDLDRYKVN